MFGTANSFAKARWCKAPVNLGTPRVVHIRMPAEWNYDDLPLLFSGGFRPRNISGAEKIINENKPLSQPDYLKTYKKT